MTLEVTFCRNCSEKSFLIWKGWPTQDALSWSGKSRLMGFLPDLPVLDEGTKCDRCNGTDKVSASHIYYKNFHSEFSTGLPDFFYLIIDERSESTTDHNLKKFGRPYLEKPVGRIPLDQLEDHVLQLFQNLNR